MVRRITVKIVEKGEVLRGGFDLDLEHAISDIHRDDRVCVALPAGIRRAAITRWSWPAALQSVLGGGVFVSYR